VRKIALSVALVMVMTAATAQDLAILNGRVMDPETGLDAVRHVLIRDGRIASISEETPAAASTIDATGLVVAPGFIDLHAHGQDLPSNRFQAADGVTTALELEIGTWPVNRFYELRRGKALINYGSTVSHVVARHAAVAGDEDAADDLGAYFQAAFGAESARRALSQNQVTATLELLREGIGQGALGFGFGITYTPGASHEEIFQAFAAAAELSAPVFVHVRAAERMGGDRLAPLQEVMANAFATRASLHIVHLNSSTDESAKAALAMIRAAKGAGLDVTTESYPYTAGSTLIQSALFDNWQADYGLLQWAATGERLTRETFEAYRRQGGAVIIHGRSEETNAWLVSQPDVMVASDGISFANGAAHPRGAGTYSRVLGHYVREIEALDLMTALSKMTLLPARRLESIAPQMKLKGRVQVGADADLTLFDPKTVIDKATYTDSMQFSAGIEHVLVNGIGVVRDRKLVDGLFPGQPVYGRLREQP
jgi:dihydroorotase